jgi:hypothetical protein
MASHMSIDEMIEDLAETYAKEEIKKTKKTVTISNEAFNLLLKAIETANELGMTLEDFLLKSIYINKQTIEHSKE